MRRLLFSLLTILFLLSQLGLAVHAYEEHDDGQLCELCLAGNRLDHALISTTATLLLDFAFSPDFTSSHTHYSPTKSRYYASRAPPFFH